MKEDYTDALRQELKGGILLRNRYLLEKIIGRGGFGLIWLAQDKKLEIPVAIKEYLLHSAQNTEDLYREGQMSARFFDQDAVAAGRDYFIEKNHFYIVLNYVEGINIKDYIRRNGSMQGGEVLQKMRPVITSIGKIHEQNIIHRDISADNLMMTKDEKIKLIDFGTARKMEDYIDKTYTQNSKYGFTPIEQYEESGVYGNQGPWTDIYSLCATMYYMITGNVPKLSALRMINDRIIPLPQIPDTRLSSHQAACIMKGLAVQPEDRYQNIHEFYEDLYETGSDEEKIEKQEEEENISPATTLHLKKNYKRKAILLSVCIVLITSSILIYAQKNNVSFFPVSQNKIDVAAPTFAAVSEKAIYETPMPTPIPEKIYTISSYKGMNKKGVRKKTKELAKGGLTITYKEKYSDIIAKGKVISQKPSAGKEYKDLRKVSLVLVLSKGSKPRSTPKPTPKPTSASVRTGRPVTSPSRKPKETETVDFSGNLDDIPE